MKNKWNEFEILYKNNLLILIFFSSLFLSSIFYLNFLGTKYSIKDMFNWCLESLRKNAIERK